MRDGCQTSCECTACGGPKSQDYTRLVDEAIVDADAAQSLKNLGVAGSRLYRSRSSNAIRWEGCTGGALPLPLRQKMLMGAPRSNNQANRNGMIAEWLSRPPAGG
ncbi:hypothetical protein LIA77_09478 [Sarocladium implicatum]|nr:hypothetical protein LIA77_09478 [Sarocladium implicatum]